MGGQKLLQSALANPDRVSEFVRRQVASFDPSMDRPVRYLRPVRDISDGPKFLFVTTVSGSLAHFCVS